MASAVETAIRSFVTKGVMSIAEFNRDRLKEPAAPHPFLTGVHTPMPDERTLTDLTVTGAIPTDLDGRYIRIGPNPAARPDPASYHWFLGDGMVHGVRLRDGKAEWYRNRWIKSTAVTNTLGLPLAPGPRSGLGDTINTNVLGHAGSIWALVEAGAYPARLDENLETIAHDPFDGSLKGSFTAHPHLDPDTGEMHAICYEGTDQNRIRHVVVGKDGRVRREEPIHVQHGPSIHDCMITANYVIILDLPVTFSMKRLLSGYKFPYAWNPAHQARVGLLPREGTNDDVIWCDVDPCYVFHPSNAYETAEGKVILDVCAHRTMFAESTQGPDSDACPLERWTIDPASKSVVRKVLDKDAQEFPRPNEQMIGKPYRYTYTLALPEGRDPAFVSSTRIFKQDLVDRARDVHDFGVGHIPGEFVFIPRAGGTEEDDGWLIGYVIDTATDTTDLVIIDARNFEGPPVASIHIPHRIPPGFHGNWVPSV